MDLRFLSFIGGIDSGNTLLVQEPLDRFGAEHQAEGAGDADEGAFFLAAGLFGAEDHREVAVEAGPLFRTRKSLNVTRI